MTMPTVVARRPGRRGEDALDDDLAPAPSFGAQPDRCRLRACGGVLRCHALLLRGRRLEGGQVRRHLLLGNRDEEVVLGDLDEFVRKNSTKP